jgi:hypothetical protein
MMLMVAAVFAVSGLAVSAEAEEAAPKAARKPMATKHGLSAGDAPAPSTARQAGPAGKRAPRPTGGSAKLGEACKVDADCDQSSSDMRCGKSKCEYDLSRAHPAT